MRWSHLPHQRGRAHRPDPLLPAPARHIPHLTDRRGTPSRPAPVYQGRAGPLRQGKAVTGGTSMRILLIASAYNSMTQRVHAELADRGHEVSVELALGDEVMRDGVRRFDPDLV